VPGGGTPGPGVSPPPQAGSYVRSFGSRGNDEAYALAALPDGGLAIGGILEQGTADRNRTSWLGVLDSSGVPIREQRVIGRDAAMGHEAFASVAVEEQGAVFAGVVHRPATHFDVVLRFRSPTGEIVWSQELDSGRWSGNVEVSGAGIADTRPHLYPVFDADGAWQGVWVFAHAASNVIGVNGEGNQQIVHRSSATLWYVRSDGVQVSRTRLVYANAPARVDVYLDSAVVLDTGSLAVALRETGTDASGERVSRAVVRRIGQDGTIGGPTVTLPAPLSSPTLVESQGALLAMNRGLVARVDISAQRLLWQTELQPYPESNFDWIMATTVVRGGTLALVIGGNAQSGDSALLQLNPVTGAQLRNCRLTADHRLLSLRGRASGNLRALLSVGDALRTTNLADDCSSIAASETPLPQPFNTRWIHSQGWGLSAEGGATLSHTGEFVHENTPTRARRHDANAMTVFDIGAGNEIRTDEGFYLLAADRRGEVGFASETLMQRRAANGSLVRASNLPILPWDIAADDEGRFWITGEGGPSESGGCVGGTVVLQADGRADCRRVTDRDLTEWTLARGPDGSVWASSSATPQTLRFASGGTVTSHTSMCVVEDLDIGADQARVGFEYSSNRICLDGNGGRSWARELNLSAFSGNLEVERNGSVKAVAADDGGVAVMFSVRQRGEIPGVRSNANILGDSDVALLKLDAAGNPQWLRVFGGAGEETSEEIVRMSDGGFALLGTSNSFDALTPGSVDLFVVRTGPDGHVARTADGGDACQACLGTITGAPLLELLGPRETATFEATPATLAVTATPLTLPEAEGVTESVPGETNARQCTGNITNVQEPATTGTPPPAGEELPVARFTVRALYGGATANPISNHDPAHFDASASTPYANLQRYEWDFEDDGIFDAEGYLQMNTYGSRGQKTARLRVTHANGRTAETTMTFSVDASAGYYVRVRPVHNENIPGNRIERIDGAINCANLYDGGVSGVCFANGSNAPGVETILRATPAAGSVFSNWVGCDLTRAQAEGPPLCVITGELDGGERLVEAHFVAAARAAVTVVMTGTTAATGAVHSMDNSINCPTTCSAQFPVGSEVELAALWSTDGDFLRFEGCDRVTNVLCFVDLGAGGRTVTAFYR
jgi:hypothetical protein